MRQSPQLSQPPWNFKPGIVLHLDCSGYSEPHGGRKIAKTERRD